MFLLVDEFDLSVVHLIRCMTRNFLIENPNILINGISIVDAAGADANSMEAYIA
jgi:hypothetical protein